MNDDAGRAGGRARDYVERVRDETTRYAHQLLSENEHLRLLVATLESERRGLAAQIAAMEERSRRFAEDYLAVERHNSSLANLYVASYRLHGTLSRRDVLDSIQEILANLVGSEQTAVFEIAGERLELVSSSGIDPARYDKIPLGEGTIGRAALSGETFLAGRSASPEGSVSDPAVTACVPLRLQGRVIGVIVVFELLPQKNGLEELDFELFELLATQAATALYCASLHSRFGAGASRDA